MQIIQLKNTVRSQLVNAHQQLMYTYYSYSQHLKYPSARSHQKLATAYGDPYRYIPMLLQEKCNMKHNTNSLKNMLTYSTMGFYRVRY